MLLVALVGLSAPPKKLRECLANRVGNVPDVRLPVRRTANMRLSSVHHQVKGNSMLRRMHLRRQVVLCICGVQFVALTVTFLVLVLNAREAVRLEIASAEKSARALMLTTLGYALQETAPSEVLPRLADALVEPRHVDISLIDPNRGVLPVRELNEETEIDVAPAWFARLVTPPLREIRLPIESNGAVYGFVSMTAAPRDEIAEVWHDVASLFWIVAATAIVAALGTAALVTRALKPLDKLRDALVRLRQGELSTRIGHSQTADLVPIFEGFDALSNALESAQSDRARLKPAHRRIGRCRTTCDRYGIT